jgi:hypothetical protein
MAIAFRQGMLVEPISMHLFSYCHRAEKVDKCYVILSLQFEVC